MTTAAALLLLVPIYSLLLLLPLGPISFASGWNIALEVSTQVSGAVGGEPFSTQPLIVVKDKLGELQSTFEGRVTVEIVDQSSMFNYGPYNFEPVWKEGEAIPTTASVDSLVSEDVAGGYATFAGLGINTADIGYQLKFVLYDEHGLLMGSVIGDEFDVIVGDTFQLSVLSQPEMSFGGAEFGSQPVLAVKDRGSNVVTDVNEGMVCHCNKKEIDWLLFVAVATYVFAFFHSTFRYQFHCIVAPSVPHCNAQLKMDSAYQLLMVLPISMGYSSIKQESIILSNSPQTFC